MNQSVFSFSRFLGGAYKTLTIANQIIPLYKQVSPVIKNARSVFSTISELNKSNKSVIKKNKVNNSDVLSQKKELSLNNPVFFV